MKCANCPNEAEHVHAPAYASDVAYCAHCLPKRLKASVDVSPASGPAPKKPEPKAVDLEPALADE